MPRSIAEVREALVGKPQSHMLTFNRESDVDVENRTVKVAFASDKPIDSGWYGQIRLMMGKKNVRTQRFDTGAPLLMDHNTRDQIGVIEDYSFDADGMARCTVRFDTAPRAEEIFQSVRSGIRKNISVGFMIWELDLEKKSKSGPDIYVANDWEPYEVSIVAVPADISVGVGRELNLRDAADETCPDCGEPIDDCECADTNSDSEASRSRAITTEARNLKNMKTENLETPAAPVVNTRSAELVLAEEIREWGRNFDCPEVATAYLRDNAGSTISKEAFFERVKANKPAPVQVPQAPAAEEAAASRCSASRIGSHLPRHGVLKIFAVRTLPSEHIALASGSSPHAVPRTAARAASLHGLHSIAPSTALRCLAI
jgi:HK97 family phage prohead protease